MHAAQGKREGHLAGIDGGGVRTIRDGGFAAADAQPPAVGQRVDALLRNADGRQGFAAAFDEHSRPVYQQVVVRRTEKAPRCPSLQCVVNLAALCGIEAIVAKHLIQYIVAGACGHHFGGRELSTPLERSDALLQQLLDDRHALRQMHDVVGSLRIEFFQQRYKVVAHLVACSVVVHIGAVGHILLAALAEKSLDIGSRHAEQRSQQIAVARTDACKSTHARTSYYIHQYGFHLVVAMVCHADARSPQVGTQLFEIAVAQAAGCRLDAQMV